jgi:hypothetical protein
MLCRADETFLLIFEVIIHSLQATLFLQEK